jgi:hypothetical protein
MAATLARRLCAETLEHGCDGFATIAARRPSRARRRTPVIIENPLNRNLVESTMPLSVKIYDGGGLTRYIQKGSSAKSWRHDPVNASRKLGS